MRFFTLEGKMHILHGFYIGTITDFTLDFYTYYRSKHEMKSFFITERKSTT